MRLIKYISLSSTFLLSLPFNHSMCLPIYLSVYLAFWLSVNLSVYLAVWQSVYLTVYLSVCLTCNQSLSVERTKCPDLGGVELSPGHPEVGCVPAPRSGEACAPVRMVGVCGHDRDLDERCPYAFWTERNCSDEQSNYVNIQINNSKEESYCSG